jgi:hypothetical protein
MKTGSAMMKWAGVLLLSFVVAGCAGRINDAMRSWVGHHYSDVIASWGPPAQVLDDGAGGKIMTWAATRSFTSPGYATTSTTANVYGNFGTANSFTTYTPPQTTSYNATRTFWVNSDGIIYRWSWRGL